MPKNTGKGGKKFKKFKKGGGLEEKGFLYKDEDSFYRQQYAKVIKILGHGRLSAICEDNHTRQCTISGKLKKRKTNGMIRRDDIILISVRPYQNHLADVLHKYSVSEVHKFLNGDITVSESFKKVLRDDDDVNDEDIVFAYNIKDTCKKDSTYSNDYSYISSDSDENSNRYWTCPTKLEKNHNRQIVYESLDDEPELEENEKKKVDKKKKTKSKKDRRKNNWKDTFRMC